MLDWVDDNPSYLLIVLSANTAASDQLFATFYNPQLPPPFTASPALLSAVDVPATFSLYLRAVNIPAQSQGSATFASALAFNSASESHAIASFKLLKRNALQLKRLAAEVYVTLNEVAYDEAIARSIEREPSEACPVPLRCAVDNMKVFLHEATGPHRSICLLFVRCRFSLCVVLCCVWDGAQMQSVQWPLTPAACKPL